MLFALHLLVIAITRKQLARASTSRGSGFFCWEVSVDASDAELQLGWSTVTAKQTGSQLEGRLRILANLCVTRKVDEVLVGGQVQVATHAALHKLPGMNSLCWFKVSKRCRPKMASNAARHNIVRTGIRSSTSLTVSRQRNGHSVVS